MDEEYTLLPFASATLRMPRGRTTAAHRKIVCGGGIEGRHEPDPLRAMHVRKIVQSGVGRDTAAAANTLLQRRRGIVRFDSAARSQTRV